MTTPPVVATDPLAGCAPPLRWLIERITPPEEALAHVNPSSTAASLYDAWMSSGHVQSAIRLVAGVLPLRESVWWAWVSARYALTLPGAKAPKAAVHDALVAVEQWIVQPDDQARRAAWEAGKIAGSATPIGMVTTAVFLGGTTIGPAHLPAVPPPLEASLPLIWGSIVTAGASGGDPVQVQATLSAFAAQGMEIVKRFGGWDAALQIAFDTYQRLAQEQP